jgi:branched-subunit amino acid aminotransferase/4-amino-4-deoxychorismate lyase
MSKQIDCYFLNNEEVSCRDINHKLFSSALFYGTGCFETMRFENKQICRFDNHINRLHRGLDYLELPAHLIPKKEYLRERIQEKLDLNGFNDKPAKIRVQCSLLEQNGYRLDSDVELLTHIRISSIEYVDKSLRLLTAKTRVIPSECRPSDLKLSNMLHYRTAFREAVKKKYDDALILTIDGNIAETSVANIFWAIDNNVYTPSKECSILPGIMRKDTIEAIKGNKKLKVEEGIYNRDSILNADLVWISNSVIEFQPVFSIDEVKLNCNEAIMNEIITSIQYYTRSNSKE